MKKIKIVKIKKVGAEIKNFKDWDILDGRTKQGKPFKKLAKVLDFGMYLLGCASLSFIIIYFLIQWMSI